MVPTCRLQAKPGTGSWQQWLGLWAQLKRIERIKWFRWAVSELWVIKEKPPAWYWDILVRSKPYSSPRLIFWFLCALANTPPKAKKLLAAQKEEYLVRTKPPGTSQAGAITVYREAVWSPISSSIARQDCIWPESTLLGRMQLQWLTCDKRRDVNPHNDMAIFAGNLASIKA